MSVRRAPLTLEIRNVESNVPRDVNIYSPPPPPKNEIVREISINCTLPDETSGVAEKQKLTLGRGVASSDFPRNYPSAIITTPRSSFLRIHTLYIAMLSRA